MSDALPRSRPENTQQVLRFTVRDPVFDEALVSLEREGDRHGSFLPDNLFLYSMKRIEIEDSRNEEEAFLARSQFGQYRKKIEDISSNGHRLFSLNEDWLHEIRSGGQDGELVGVGFRVRFDDVIKNAVIAPPLYGNGVKRSPQDDELNKLNAQKLLAQARAGGYIPIYYKMGRTMDNPEYAVERLRSVVRLGVKVTGLTVVPWVARDKNIFMTPPMERTYDKVDAYFSEKLGGPSFENVG